jgi:hypothetical protein
MCTSHLSGDAVVPSNDFRKEGMRMKSDSMNGDVRPLTKEKLGRRVLQMVGALAILSVVATGTPQAAQSLTFSIADPAGDQKGTIDVTGMTMTWTPSNGKWDIVLTADPAHPFTGQFRVNIHVYNPNSTSSGKVFQYVCSQCQKFGNMNKSDIDLGSATTTTLTLSGNGNQEIKLWMAGDPVATNSYAGLGNPPGSSLFRSSVNVQPVPGTFLTHEDMIGADDQTWDGNATWDGSSGLATIVVGP